MKQIVPSDLLDMPNCKKRETIEMERSGISRRLVFGGQVRTTVDLGKTGPTAKNFYARSLPIILTLVLAGAVVPGFRIYGIPVDIDLSGIASAYWYGTALAAIFTAAVLASIESPKMLYEIATRYWADKGRLIAFSVFVIAIFCIFPVVVGAELATAAIAITELLDRRPDDFIANLKELGISAGYLFLGLIVVFCLNHLVATAKVAESYDLFFNRFDQRIFHITPGLIFQAALQHLPPWYFRAMEFVYYGLFAEVGGVLVLCAISRPRCAIRFVGTLLIAYYIAIATFWFVPSIGPFSLNETYPESLSTHAIQQSIYLKAQALHARKFMHGITAVNPADSYIAFPSLHVALASIAFWYVRHRRRIAVALVVFQILLIVSIVSLEWHYLIDLLGGFALATAAIKLTSAKSSPNSLSQFA